MSTHFLTKKSTAKEKKIALAYIRGDMTRAEVNRAFGLRVTSQSGASKIARAIRDLYKDGVLGITQDLTS